MEAAKPSSDAWANGEHAEKADMQLVSAVLSKDRKATAEFVALHADRIYAYVYHRLIPRADLVEDIVQEVFLAAWESLNKFQGTSSLASWLLGIARHKVEDYYRARLREADPIEPDENQLPSLFVETPDFEGSLDRKRLEKRIRQVLSSLPEVYSLALLWRYWEKRSAREIAAATGKTEKAVERILARARAQFKRRWNDE